MERDAMGTTRADAALILAAGKGTRMCSSRPKVLHTMLDHPLLGYVIRAVQPLFGGNVWTVIGHGGDQVRGMFAEKTHFVEQAEQLGTGHALMCALPDLHRAGIERLLVVNGDTPLLTSACLSDFCRAAAGLDVAFASLTLPDPGPFGRVLRKDGAVTAIVEAKDYDPVLHGPASGEVNAGWYVLNLPAVAPLVPRLTPAAAGGEYYLTDLIGLAAAAGLAVGGLNQGGAPHLLGVNTPAELAGFEERLRRMIVERLLDSGVIMHAPDLVRVGPEAVVEPGAELSGPCDIFGASRIASGASVAAYCVLRNVTVAGGAAIHSFCHLQEAVIGPDCLIGPYARLRPGAVVEAEAHVGNFVELKKARLGAKAKANHLAYLGDVRIGPGSNIGAGAITCNYDGARKHETTIGAGAFIGSNVSLVAPVSIGAGAVVGAGSTITKDVPAAHLGLTRASQKSLPWKRKAGD